MTLPKQIVTRSTHRFDFDLRHWCFGVNWCWDDSWKFTDLNEKQFIFIVHMGPLCFIRRVFTPVTPEDRGEQIANEILYGKPGEGMVRLDSKKLLEAYSSLSKSEGFRVAGIGNPNIGTDETKK